MVTSYLPAFESLEAEAFGDSSAKGCVLQLPLVLSWAVIYQLPCPAFQSQPVSYATAEYICANVRVTQHQGTSKPVRLPPLFQGRKVKHSGQKRAS